MALTLQQLQAARDALVTSLGAPAEVHFSDHSVRNRSIAEIRAAISEVDDQIALLGGAASRVSLAQHKRGDGPSGPTPFSDRDW
jgi:hypothetical protein